jgi:hypothetical protein
MNKTTEFIKSLTAELNKTVPTTYESAPVESDYCYAVVNGLYFSNPAEHEDSATFYVDIYTNESQATPTVTLEETCDAVRDAMQNTILHTTDFYAHIGFEGRTPTAESEVDLSHRRLTFSAKIIYIGG